MKVTRAKTVYEQRRDAALHAEMRQHAFALEQRRNRQIVPIHWSRLPEADAAMIRLTMFVFLEVFGEPLTFDLRKRTRNE